ncbi:hypothetical protein [Paracoccus saliphilus]|uniref:Uncharacterized protein n=1 Tax=Paracoccus saliphilus TaxID=405559 RepID=A0AA45W874_9RHOB|nr:hypothetical protein [Paracoccus saliphilus]WCR05537.1 hypothetical protein JHX88_22010 [Paracoccus saliphilus]SIT15116.1 hypothetical protein SAMN05421772_12538 [Paracoccus saliphilus]
MTLILLAILLTIVACVIACHLAIWALSVMVAITAARYAWAGGSGVLLSGIIAIGAALLAIALVIVVLGFTRNPLLRFIALTGFAVPAMIAGYALVYGITRNLIDSVLAVNLLGGLGGLVIGISAIAHLNALGESICPD